MSLNIGDNFSYLGKKFLDNRQSFDTLELMNACSDVPVGFVTFCKEDGKRYEYTDNGWVEYGFNMSEEDIEKINAAYDHSQTEHVQPSDLEGFATEEYVMNKITEAELNGEEVDLTVLVTKSELASKGYLTEIPSEYVTEEELQAGIALESAKKIDNIEVNEAETNDTQIALNLYANSELVKTVYFNRGKDVDLSGYVSKEELENKGYLTKVPSDYITEDELENKGYLTEVPSEYINEEELENKGYLTEHQDLSDYATIEYVNGLSLGGGDVDIDLSGYATKSDLQEGLAPKFDNVEVNEAETNDTQTALDFYSNGEVLKTLYFTGGGGAPSAPPYISTMLPENSILGLGEVFDLQLDFSSSVTGRGTLKIFINDVEIRSVSIPQGENVIPVEDVNFTKGTNRLVVYVIDRTGAMSNSLTFYVRYGSLEIASDFDAYSSYDYGAVVRYYFTPTAVDTSLSLTMYMNIDGEVKPGVSCASDTRGYYTFPSNLGVGAHYCQAYVVDSGGNTSNILAFNLVIIDDTSLVVASDTVNPTVEEGSQLVLDYKVYMKGNTSFITKTYVDGNLVNTGTCGLALEYYRTSNLREGIHTIKMEVFDVTETVSDYIIWTVNVTPSTYDMLQPVSAGAMFIGSARNMTNSSENKEIWAGVDQDGNPVNGILNGFAFNSENGWVNDEILMTGTSSVEIPIAPLANNARYGFTLDLEFASKAIGVEDALVLNLWDEVKDCGVKITTEKVILRSAEGNECDLYFTDDEMTSVIFVIDRNEATAKIYLNGVMCSAFHLSDYSIDGVPYLEDFSVDSTIMLGGSGHARIKNLRVYQVALTTDEILNNFMANETDKAAQQALVAFQKGDHLPTLTVYCDFSGLGKDDKKPCSITYLSTDEEKYGKSFTLSHKKSSLQYQGTSSMAYPIKNYRLNLADEAGNKWRYDFPFGKPEYRYTLKADFMSSGHWTNTGLTKWINKNLYNYNMDDEKSMNPKKWYDINNGGSLDDTRECIYGFPCRLILVNDGNTPLNEGQNEPTPGNTKDMGIFNFNHDKDATDTMGFDDDVFPNCASYEVTANSDTSAGAFMSYKGYTIQGIRGHKGGAWVTARFDILNLLEYLKADTLIFESDAIFQGLCEYYTPGSSTKNYFDARDGKPFDAIYYNADRVVLYFTPDTRPTWIKINGVEFEFIETTDSSDIPTLVIKEEADELDYIKQSFELRFPDEDDVPEGWGFMGWTVIDCRYDETLQASGEVRTTVFEINPGETLNIEVDVPGLIRVDFYEGSTWLIDRNNTDVNKNTCVAVPPSNANRAQIRLNAEWRTLTINGEQILRGDTYYSNTNIVKNSYINTGLKGLIDWVDGCSDEEFVRDFEEHFHKDYTLRYFLLVITLGMVDNLGKNMMFDTWDNKIFMPRFYDCDTICSYDNSGQLKFDVDIEMAQGYWNTSSSRLWTRVRDLFHDELVEKYNNMRQNGLSYESLMACFYDEQIAKIPQKYYNMDYDVKYAPFADSYIGMANGDVYEHVKRWLQQRIRFVDTLYDYAPSYNNDVLTIRANTTEPMTLEIETYTPVYQHLSWYNGQMDKKKIDGKISVSFTGTAMAATDQEVLIYGGSNIKKIRGISSMNPNRMLIGSATRLIELEAPNCPLLADVNSNKANFAPHTYLNKLNISGCPLLGGNLILNNSPLIRDIDIRGTAITGLNLPSNVRNLEVLRLPAAISNLILNDAGQLHTIEFEEGAIINTVSMTNCNALSTVINFDFRNASSVSLNNSYNTVRELYFRDTTNLSLSNMPSLERVVYTPNDEYETFDKGYLATRPDYKITTFNVPKCTQFIVTAPQRLSYGESIANYHKPNELINRQMWNRTYPYPDCYSSENPARGYSPTPIYTTPGYTYKIINTSDKVQVTLHPFGKDSISTVDLGWLENNTIVTPTADVMFYVMYFSMVDGSAIDEALIQSSVSIYEASDEIKPDSVFSANSIDISGTRFTDVKLLSTTDTNSLKLPSTVKNVVVDSAYDIDTKILPDATYETIHDELYVPYNSDYEDEIKYSSKKVLIYPKGTSSTNSVIIPNINGKEITITPIDGTNYGEYCYVRHYSSYESAVNGTPQLETSIRGTGWGIPIVISTTRPYIIINMPTHNATYELTYYAEPSTPNIVPSSSDGSIIYSINSEQEGIWDMDGLDIETFHTFGINNDVKLVNGNLTMPFRNDEFSYQIDNLRLPNEVANYTASNMNTFPTFNSEFTYTSIVSPRDGIYEYRILADDMDNLPTKISFYANGDNNTLLTVDYLNLSRLDNCGNMFKQCKALTSVNTANWDVSNIVVLASMFYACSSLTSVDLSGWDTKNVTDMGGMFTSCGKLKTIEGIGDLDTSNVAHMSTVFQHCSSLTSLDLSGWNTESAEHMTHTFQNCSSLTSLDLSGWNTGNVTNMQSMFYGCGNLQSINASNWDIKNVKNMYFMFHGCGKLTELDVSNWDVGNVTNMQSVFENCYSLTSLDLSKWDISNVTNMSSMFTNCAALQELRIDDWPLNDITQTAISSLPVGNDAKNEIHAKIYFTIPSGWEIINPLDIIRFTCATAGTRPKFNFQFSGYSALETANGDGTYTVKIATDDLSNLPTTVRFDATSIITLEYLNTSNLNNMYMMFYSCPNLTRVNALGWDTSKVADMYCAFTGDASLQTIEGIENWNTGKVENMNMTFSGCSNLTSLDVSGWDVGKVTTVASMFQNCSSLTSLDLSKWDISNVTSMQNMFYGCGNLQSINASNWDTKNVMHMEYMFNNCANLTSLDVSNWDVGKVTNFSFTFNGCIKLTSLDVSKWNVEKVTNMDNMFSNCSVLEYFEAPNWNTSSVTTMRNMFSLCGGLERFVATNWDVDQVTSCSYFFNMWGVNTKLTHVDMDNWTFVDTDMNGMFISANKLTTLKSPTFHKGLSFADSPLSVESILDIINKLPTVSVSQTMQLGAQNLAKLSEEQIAIATNKGWTLS